MAKGITQEQVNQAADSLLLVGERPTIDRIRSVLGTGSPNTVNRYLDAWWVNLGQRLTQVQVKLALPDAPAEITALASQFWERALASARAQAQNEIEAEREVLAGERMAKAIQRVQLEEHRVKMIAERDAAYAERDIALTRITDLQHLIDRQNIQLNDMSQQRDSAVSHATAGSEALVLLQSELKVKEQLWKDERSAIETLHTTMHDRWLIEVDRARQDEAKSTAKLKQLEQASTLASRQSSEQLADCNKRLVAADREDAKKTAKLASLEDEIMRLHAQLKLRLQPKTPTSSPSKKKVSASKSAR